MKNIKLFICDFLAPGLICIFLLAAFVDAAAWNSCKNYSEMTGNTAEYRHLDACYIKRGEEWVRMNSFN